MTHVDTMLLAIANQANDKLVAMAIDAIDQLYAVCDELARRDLSDQEKDVLRRAHRVVERLTDNVRDHCRGGEYYTGGSTP